MENNPMSLSKIKSIFFENKTLNQTIFKNIFWLTVAEIFTKLAGFFTIVILARHFGPSDYGKFSFALSAATIFTIFADFGLGVFAVREITRDKERTSQYIDNIFAIKVVLGLITFLALFLLVRITTQDSLTLKLTYLLGIYSILSTFSAFFRSVFQANEKMEYDMVSRWLESWLTLLLIILAVISRQTILSVGYIYIAGAIIGVVFPLIIVAKYFSKIFLKISFNICVDIFKTCWPFGLSVISIAIYYYLGSVFLGIMRGSEEVGFFNSGMQIIFAVTPLSSILFFSFFPPIARFFKEGSEKLKDICNQYASMLFAFGIPLGFGGFFVAQELITFLYGNQYSGAVIPFKILSWNLAMIFISSAYGNSLQACDKQIEVFKATSLAAVSNILLNLVLIPKYGASGVAIASLLTETIIFVKVYQEFNKISSIDFIKCSLVPLLASLVMGLGIYIAKFFGLHNALALISIGVGVYGLLFFILKKLFLKYKK